MKASQLHPSRFLSKEDLGNRSFTLTMDRYSIEEMSEGPDKPVVWFQGAKKGLVLKPAITNIIAMIHGDEMDAWWGKQIEVFVDPTISMGNRIVGGVRVRPAAVAGNMPQMQPAEPAPPLAQPYQPPPGPPGSLPSQVPDADLEDEIPF